MSTQFCGGCQRRRGVRLASKALTICLRHSAGSDQNDVEADVALRVVRMMREPKLGGGDDAPLAALGHGFGRVVDALARLDLDENQVARRRRATISISPKAFSSAAPRSDSPWR